MDRILSRFIVTPYLFVLLASGTGLATDLNKPFELPPLPDFGALELAVFSGHKGPKLGDGGMAIIYAAKPGWVFKVPRATVNPHDLMIEIMGHKEISDVLADAGGEEDDSGHRYLMGVLGIARLAEPWWRRWWSRPNRVPRIIFTLEEGGVDLWRLRKKISTFEAVAMAHQVAEALAFLHERDLVHFDVKPGNILAAPGGKMRVMLGDFGFVSQTGSDVRTRGTYRYLPPELIESRLAPRNSPEAEFPAHPSADIFSFMVTACELITRGAEPFDNTVPLESAFARDELDRQAVCQFLESEGYNLTGLPPGNLLGLYRRARMRSQIKEVEQGPLAYKNMKVVFGSLYPRALHCDPEERPQAKSIAERLNHFLDFHYGAYKADDGSPTLLVKVNDAVVVVPFTRKTTLAEFKDSLFLLALREKPDQAVRRSAIARLLIQHGSGAVSELTSDSFEVRDGMGLSESDDYVTLELKSPDEL